MASQYHPTVFTGASVDVEQRSAPWPVVIREGVVAGVLGATTLALWFMLLDVMAGRPLHTPTVLGTAFLRWGLEPGALDSAPVSLERVLAYTLAHGLAFAVLGVIASLFLRWQTGEANLAMGTMLFFVVFVLLEFGFRMARAILFDSQIESEMAWERVVIGNFFGAAVMGYYLMRRLPRQTASPV